MRQQTELPPHTNIVGLDVAYARMEVRHSELYDELVAVTRRALGYDFGDLEADQKSIVLLKEWLTPEQLKDFEQTNSFDVKGCLTGARYRISKARSFGVRRMDVNRLLCFVPTTANSLGDIMLAQKIMLETNETKALKIANWG